MCSSVVEHLPSMHPGEGWRAWEVTYMGSPGSCKELAEDGWLITKETCSLIVLQTTSSHSSCHHVRASCEPSENLSLCTSWHLQQSWCSVSWRHLTLPLPWFLCLCFPVLKELLRSGGDGTLCLLCAGQALYRRAWGQARLPLFICFGTGCPG